MGDPAGSGRGGLMNIKRAKQEIKNTIRAYQPVSYTHLDVYKRQELLRANI